MKISALTVLLTLGTLTSTAWAVNDPASDLKRMMDQPVKMTEADKQKFAETKKTFIQAADSAKAKESKADAFSKSTPDACVRPKADVFSQAKADVLSKLKPDTFNK